MMARSLRDLIDFLLGEISLCGDRGTSPADILNSIDNFYNASTKSSRSSNGTCAGRQPVVDRKFKQKVWTWLTRNPEVSVGKDREGNSFSLDEVEALCENGIEQQPPDNSHDDQPTLDHALPKNLRQAAKTEGGPSNPSETLRVFVSESRMWLAITGHEPDLSMVPHSEFALLSIIAASKEKGMVQSELAKLSGQDNRSIPKRTNALCKKGYIEKKPIQFKSTRTSLCTLRKFAGKPLPGEQQANAGQDENAHNFDTDNMIEFPIFLNKLFGILKETQVTSRNELKQKLGMEDPWHRKVLRRAIRKLEMIGCVRRVKTAIDYSNSTRATHASILLLREPTEKDLKLFHLHSGNLVTSLEQGGPENEAEEDQEMEEANAVHLEDMGNDDSAIKGVNYLEPVGRTVPQWIPDRSMSNTISRLVDQAGTKGMTNHEILKVYMGPFYKRPLENLLARIVESWQLSQPPHLQHFSLVRDSAMKGTNAYFVHYSLRNFATLVEDGQASWEVVERGPREKATAPTPLVDAAPKLDEYGFPLDSLPANLLNDGNVTLRQCLEVHRLFDYHLTISDPRLVQYEDGSYGVIGPSKPQKGRFVRHLDELNTMVNADDSNKHKRRIAEVVGEGADEVSTPTRKKKKPKDDTERFAGMSEKEKLEAQGFDETWTEYSLLLLDRPHTGMFLTPSGRRRPVGKARGRPPKSRIAVIKSARLVEFSWFTSNNIDGESPAVDAQLACTGDQNQPPVSHPIELDSVAESDRQSPSFPEADKNPGHVESPQTSVPRRQQQPDDDVEVMDEHPDARKRKQPEADDIASSVGDAETSTRPPPRRRGRPPKRRKIVRMLPSREVGDADNAPAVSSAQIEDSMQPAREHSLTPQKGRRGHKLRVSQVTPPPITMHLRSQRSSADEDKEQEQEQEPAELEAEPEAHNFVNPRQDQQPSASNNFVEDQHASVNGTRTQTTDQPPRQGIASTEGREDETSKLEAEVIDPTPAPTEPKATNIDQPSVESICEPTHLRPSIDLSLDDTETISVLRNQNSVSQSRLVSQTMTPEIDIKPTIDSKGRVKSKRQDTRGGSVAFIRKNIVMDIVEKTGGAFPMGSELWYPFTTAWLKTNHKERPDQRTIRSAVRSLMESGKLLQHTFSGRNPKGLVVTKSVIAKPDISATDPLITDMQKRMLEADPQFYIPLEVEVDPSLRKSHHAKQTTLKIAPEVRPDLTVTLQQKPAQVRLQELRQRDSFKRRYPLGFGRSVDAAAEGGIATEPRVKRLKTTKRRSAYSYVNALTITPNEGASEQTGPGGAVPVRKQLLAKSKYSLMMSPPVAFHAPSGTFGTGVRDVLKPKRKTKQFQPIGELSGTLDGVISTSRRRRGDQDIIAAKSKYAMTMSPLVAFHAPTGTFGTVVREVLKPGRRPKQLQPIRELPETPDGRFSTTRRRLSDQNNIAVSEINAVHAWDKNNLENDGWKYVNHTMQGSFEPVPLGGSIRFESDKTRDRDEKLTQWPSSRMSIPDSLAASSVPLEPTPARQSGRTKPSGPRRLAQLQASTATPAKKAALERSNVGKRARNVRSLSENTIRKLMVALVVVRTLAGGLEGKMIDWPIVASLFPDYDPNLVKRRGKDFMSRNRLQIAKVQSDFQERFAEAYEKDQVPPIDYDNLEAYDWKWVVDWAQDQLEMPKLDKLPSLPATREQFDSLFEIRKEPMQNIDEIYQLNAPATIQRKQALFAGVPFSIPLSQAPKTARQPLVSNQKLDIAKTWVRANVVTPEEMYSPIEARKLLEYLGEELVGQAIHSLTTERVISMGNRGRVTPGRNYDVTEFFLNTFHRKRPIESTQLKRAALFKTTILDLQLHLEGACNVNYDAEDGDTLALINLLAEGRIKIWPRNPPRDKYGLTGGGYLTRLMDKGRLRFDIEVHAIPEVYVYGNPLEERVSATPIPRGDLPLDFPSPAVLGNGPPLCRIPLWFDIHGKFVPLLWDLVVCAVIGMIATRPGLSTTGILRVFQPCLAEWEIQLVLVWMEEVGVVGKVGDKDIGGCGWGVKEWWWMIA